MDSPQLKSHYYSSSPIQNHFTVTTEVDRCYSDYYDLSGVKSNSNEEEILEDDEEQIPQVPLTFEKKMPQQMNKYFSDRSRAQSDGATTYNTFHSFLSQKTYSEQEKKQNKLKKQEDQQQLVGEDQLSQLNKNNNNNNHFENSDQKEINCRTNKIEKESILDQPEIESYQPYKEVKIQEGGVVGEQEEEKTQLPEYLDQYSSPQITPQKEIYASNNIFNSQSNQIFDTPIQIEQFCSPKDSHTPTRLFQQNSEQNQVEQQQQQIIKQRLNTESTQSSVSSNLVTVFQMATPNSCNSNNQCGSNINSLSNTSFSSTSNEHNMSSFSTKPSEASINESSWYQEIQEIAVKLKKLPIEERKATELNLIKELNKDKSLAYIIDMGWAVKYTKWILDTNSQVPFNQSITNMNLVDQNKKAIRSGIKEKVDYDILSYKMYFLVNALYGGGPDIPLVRSSKTNEQVKSNNQIKYPSQMDTQLTKQSSSTSTAATNNSSMIDNQHNRLIHQNKMPLSLLENQIISSQTVVVRPQQIYKKQLLSAKGLHNQSNYCYLNASIQCFLSISEMNGYFLSDEYKRAVRSQQTRKPLRLVPVYSDMVKLYEKTSDRSILDMHLLKKAIKKPFIPHEQHDAQELIRYVLSEIQDELNPVLPQKNPIQFEDPEGAYKYYLKYQNSIIDIIFSGQLSSNVHCNKCGYVSKTFDPFLDLSLGMDGKTTTIQDCLNKFFCEEILSDDYKCDKCNQNNKAKKQVLISKTPYILTLHLKRFKIYPKKKKITDFVKFPLINLSIKQYLKGGSVCGGYYYNLIGVIVHSGSQDSGHYISFVKRENRWFQCDDCKIQEVSEKTVLNQEAYLLFYQRIEESSDVSQVKKQQQQQQQQQ